MSVRMWAVLYEPSEVIGVGLGSVMLLFLLFGQPDEGKHILRLRAERNREKTILKI